MNIPSDPGEFSNIVICRVWDSLRSCRSCDKAENLISGGEGGEFDFWGHVERVQKKRLGRGEKLEGRSAMLGTERVHFLMFMLIRQSVTEAILFLFLSGVLPQIDKV